MLLVEVMCMSEKYVTVKISEEAFEYVRKIAFETRRPIQEVLSNAVMNNVKGVQ